MQNSKDLLVNLIATLNAMYATHSTITDLSSISKKLVCEIEPKADTLQINELDSILSELLAIPFSHPDEDLITALLLLLKKPISILLNQTKVATAVQYIQSLDLSPFLSNLLANKAVILFFLLQPTITINLFKGTSFNNLIDALLLNKPVDNNEDNWLTLYHVIYYYVRAHDRQDIEVFPELHAFSYIENQRKITIQLPPDERLVEHIECLLRERESAKALKARKRIKMIEEAAIVAQKNGDLRKLFSIFKEEINFQSLDAKTKIRLKKGSDYSKVPTETLMEQKRQINNFSPFALTLIEEEIDTRVGIRQNYQWLKRR